MSSRSFSLHSRQNASRFSRLGLKQRTRSIPRTAAIAISCAPAWNPEPMIAAVRASVRARYFAPNPLVAPTRIRCMAPSGKIASGSPVSVLNSSTSPTQRLFGAAGTFTRRGTPPISG